MISTIRGILTIKTPTAIVIEACGVGFQLIIPLSSYQALGNVGDEVRILTYLHVREDALQLFGFATEKERQLFQMLISITGIGPKLAQSILSGVTVDAFKEAVRNHDLTSLIRIPGVGKKTAERLVLELREKIGEPKPGEGVFYLASTSVGEEAVLALVSLGYKRLPAQEAVQKVLMQNSVLSAEEVIRLVLQRI